MDLEGGVSSLGNQNYGGGVMKFLGMMNFRANSDFSPQNHSIGGEGCSLYAIYSKIRRARPQEESFWSLKHIRGMGYF